MRTAVFVISRCARFVKRKIASSQRFSERKRFLKRQAQTLPGHAVDGARSIAHQRHISAHHSTRPAKRGDRAAFSRHA